MWQFLLLRALRYIFCLSINCLVFIFAYFFCSLEWNKIFIWSIMPAEIKCHQEWIIFHLCPYWLIPWNLTDVFQKSSSFYGQNFDLTSINSMIFFLTFQTPTKDIRPLKTNSRMIPLKFNIDVYLNLKVDGTTLSLHYLFCHRSTWDRFWKNSSCPKRHWHNWKLPTSQIKFHFSVDVSIWVCSQNRIRDSSNIRRYTTIVGVKILFCNKQDVVVVFTNTFSRNLINRS